MTNEGQAYLVLASHKADAADFIYLAGFTVQEGIGEHFCVYKPYLFPVALVGELRTLGEFQYLMKFHCCLMPNEACSGSIR